MAAATPYLPEGRVAVYPGDLIFEQLAQWFDQLQMHPFRQPSHIMMRLDGLRRSLYRDRFDHIRIQCALNQVVDRPNSLRFFLKDADEFISDELAFLFRVADPGQDVEKTLGRVDTP